MHPALAIRPWRDQAHLSVAEESSVIETDKYSFRPRTPSPSRKPWPEPLERAFYYFDWNRGGNGATMGVPMKITKKAFFKLLQKAATQVAPSTAPK
jgi:hypothetical protein